MANDTLPSETHQMATVEFKFVPNQAQESRLNSWLSAMKWVWNECLRVAIDYDLVYEAEKFLAQSDSTGLDFSQLFGCPVWQFHWEKPDGSKKWQATRPYSKIALDRKEYIPCCPINRDYIQPRVKTVNHFGLTYCFSKKLHPDKPWLCDVPSAFISGEAKTFGDSWQAYKKGVRKKPRFKRRIDKVDSLINVSSKDTKISGNYIKIPLLGEINVKTLSARWNPATPVSVLKICRRASGWYIQLTGTVDFKPEPASDRTCGLDIGLQYIIADDAGKIVEPPKFYRSAEQKLKRLQRKVSRQRLMNDGETNGTKRTRKQIARQHEKIANQRRNFNHKISTYTVRTFGSIAMEDINLSNLNRKPKAKPSEDGKGYDRNNAAAKAGLNKSFADAGLGQLRDMIKSKAKSHHRDFELVAPHYTSQDCPSCGHRAKKSLSQRTHKCSECGFIAQRDVAAAMNIKAKADFL